jgi:hypothetical protein
VDQPDTTADLLRFLIRRMDEEIEAGSAPVPALLLRLDGADVACAVDGVDLHVKPLDGHPAHVLGGFTAPPEWFGVGVLTGGWAYEPGVERRRVRMTAFVCRDGTELSGLRVSDGELQFMESNPEGLVADTLRRVLGMPTTPADISISAWLALCWLQIICERAKRGKRAPKLEWREAASLHPAIGVTAAGADELATVGPRIAAAMRWERFRQLHVDEGNDVAAWMDEGMFARWMVNGSPPLADLLTRAGKRLTPAARAKVEATLTGWGLLDRASVA